MLNEKQESAQSETVARKDTRRGILFVVSSPSGGGKGTLIQHVLKKVPNVSYSVSYTTRAPRNGEVEGREYFFVTPQQFEAMVAAGEFLEWAHVHGKLYGTSRHQVSQEVFAGRDIILEVDVQGAASVRELVTDSVGIFILPPSLNILRERLQTRGTDSPEELELRLRKAPEELKDYKLFDYVIINDEVERAANQLACIVEAERARRARQEPHVKKIVESFL
ncbi:MAG: guanylate kinase [Pyrinomonadaceae bacterium]